MPVQRLKLKTNKGERPVLKQISSLMRYLIPSTSRAQLSHSLARFSFELGGNSNQTVHSNSEFTWNFELEITSI